MSDRFLSIYTRFNWNVDQDKILFTANIGNNRSTTKATTTSDTSRTTNTTNTITMSDLMLVPWAFEIPLEMHSYMHFAHTYFLHTRRTKILVLKIFRYKLHWATLEHQFIAKLNQ